MSYLKELKRLKKKEERKKKEEDFYYDIYGVLEEYEFSEEEVREMVSDVISDWKRGI